MSIVETHSQLVLDSSSHNNRLNEGPKFKLFVLRQEMEKRHIAASHLALALDIPLGIITGSRGGNFPFDKVDLCLELLNNWTGPRTGRSKNNKPAELKPVTRETLLQFAAPF